MSWDVLNQTIKPARIAIRGKRPCFLQCAAEHYARRESFGAEIDAASACFAVL